MLKHTQKKGGTPHLKTQHDATAPLNRHIHWWKINRNTFPPSALCQSGSSGTSGVSEGAGGRRSKGCWGKCQGVLSCRALRRPWWPAWTPLAAAAENRRTKGHQPGGRKNERQNGTRGVKKASRFPVLKMTLSYIHQVGGRAPQSHDCILQPSCLHWRWPFVHVDTLCLTLTEASRNKSKWVLQTAALHFNWSQKSKTSALFWHISVTDTENETSRWRGRLLVLQYRSRQSTHNPSWWVHKTTPPRAPAEGENGKTSAFTKISVWTSPGL